MMKQFILTTAAFLCMAGPTANADDGADWPDIPLLSITTEDGAFPTCEIVYPPEGCVGTGIEAEYVKGRLVMTLRKDTLYDSGEYVKDESGMRVKIRGNSTGASEGQKPYKIKLSKKFDMLCRGDEDYKEKDWNLLKISTWNPGFDGAESNQVLDYSPSGNHMTGQINVRSQNGEQVGDPGMHYVEMSLP